MATINFTQGKFESFLDDGTPNNGGDVGFFVADGAYSTPLTTYSDSALTTSNAHPLVLDSAGRGTVFFTGNADVRIRDSAAATVYTQRNVNPSVLIASYLYSTAQTLSSVHAESMIEATGTTTLSLTDAATLAEGWRCWIKNTGTGVVTIARLSGGDKINGTAANITLPAGAALMIAVADAVDGFTTYGVNLGDSNTWTGSNTWTPVQFFTAGIGPNYLQNIGVAASVSSKALTVALKTKALADASTTDYGQIEFRNSTLTTGSTVTRNMVAATSVVAPSGATLGFAAAATGYIYVYALDNSGTIEAVLSGSNRWDESTVQSTTAISATADSDVVLYSTTARTNVPIRYLGRIKIVTGAVAGEWDNAPTEVYVGALAPASLSYIRLNTANGYGSTNTKIRRFTNTVNNVGADITYADSAADGATFTINTSGVYSASYSDQFNSNNLLGLSINSTQLTTNISSITAADILAVSMTAAGDRTETCAATFFASAGSVIRAHGDAAPSGVTVNGCQFTIARVA